MVAKDPAKTVPASCHDPSFTMSAVPAAKVGLDAADEGRIIECNEALATLLGEAADAAIGSDLRRRIVPDTAWPRLLERTRQRRESPLNIELLTQAGTSVTCDAYLAPLGVDGLGLLQLVTTALPQVSSPALRESEKRLQAVLDNVPALVYVKDLEGRYLMMNRRCRDRLSIAPGMVDSQWAPPLVAATYVAHDQEVLGLGVPQEYHETVREDGRDYQYISLKFPIFDDRGHPYAIAGVSTDITAVKDAENAAERAREVAESANRSKSEFLSRVSHELRTPMNSILGYAQLVAAGKEADPEAIAARIVEAGQHLLGLINDLLEISGIEQGVHTVDIRPVHACAPVEEAVAVARPLAEARGVELELDLHAGLYVFLAADPLRLRQVLLNLIANAVAYGPSPGSVAVTLQRPSESTVRFCVRDDGEGPPSHAADRLFDPFDRLDRTDDGTLNIGLGLSLCKALVEAMAGEIGYDGENGSCFWVDLPVTAAPADAFEAVFQTDGRESRPEHLTRPVRVLCVEDNAYNIDVLSRALKHLGSSLTLIAADSVQQALHLIGEATFDLVLLDLHLPDGSGMAVLDHLRGDAAAPAVPVIMLSADATPRQIDRCLSSGATHYLTKPLDLDLLVATMEAVLNA